MNLDIQPDGQMALATADVAHGWRRLTHTCGFCEESRVETADGMILRVQAAIRAWPNKLGSLLVQYPKNVYGQVKEEWGRTELREEDLRIVIDLQGIRAKRLPRSGLPGIYLQPVELDKSGRIGFWYSLLILLAPKAQREYPDILEWDTQFVMGGRPGSSRRH
jgi:hypothetical protein